MYSDTSTLSTTDYISTPARGNSVTVGMDFMKMCRFNAAQCSSEANSILAPQTKGGGYSSDCLASIIPCFENDYPYTVWMIQRFLQTPGPEIINFLSCSTQLSMIFFLLINVKMPTIVGILAFMSRKNSILGLSESEKAEFLDVLILMSI